MSPTLVFVLFLFALAYGAVAVFAMRHRLLARLAYREAVRRAGQTALVIAGLMVGTATITAALVAADSVSDSAVDAFAFRNWGYVDLTVGSSGRYFPQTVADQLAADPSVQGVTDGVAAGIDAYGSASDLTTRQGTSGVTLVGFDPAAQAPFGKYELLSGRSTDGSDLLPGQVLISRVLADKLHATAGDTLTVGLETAPTSPGTVNALPGPVELRIAGVAKLDGPGGYTLSSVVFAPLQTAQELLGTDQINVVRISAPGGIRDSLDAAKAATPVLTRAVSTVDAGVPLTVTEAKPKEVDQSYTNTSFIRALLIGMSALVVAAGAALVVNLIGMLAEERRSRMGVLRALGLKRRSLIGLAVIEGAWYSVAAGVVGVVAGVLAGRFIAGRFAHAFALFAGEDFDFEFHFSLHPSTVIGGFAAGTVLTLVVVFFAARRTSRMTITAAIRNLPDPPAEKRQRPWPRRIRLAVFTVLGLLGLVGPSSFSKLVGGIALILVAASLVKSRLSSRAHSTLTGLALAALSFGIIAGQSPDENAGAFFLVFVVAMLTAVFGLTILASANLRVAESIVGLLGKAFSNLRATLRPPLAYLSRRPVRTGLTTGVFAVVVAMLSLFAVFFVIFRPDYQRFGNGYDVRVLSTGSASVTLPENVQPELQRTVSLPTVGYVGPTKGEDQFATSERAFVPLFTVDASAIDDPPVRLEDRGSGYDTDQEVWKAVLADPTKVITNFGTPGNHFTLQGDDGPVEYSIIGSQSFGLMDGMFGSEQTFAHYAGAPHGLSMLLDVRDGVDADGVARDIEAQLFGTGVDADSVQALLDRADRSNRAFFSTIDVLMRMGLVVGILSLGIVALRIVVERRHVIGVLRALGYKKSHVLGGLMTEATVTAAIGAVVGLVVGVIMGYVFYRQQDSKPGFGIDFGSIGGVLLLIFVAVQLVTIGPAWRASRLPPAEAVRYTE
jgi:putative ABC transport system permease protein